jgi:hypothetical protein
VISSANVEPSIDIEIGILRAGARIAPNILEKARQQALGIEICWLTSPHEASHEIYEPVVGNFFVFV